ncbi:MAG: tyrosine-type recombinase/integrase [Stenotrophobium sp.]
MAVLKFAKPKTKPAPKLTHVHIDAESIEQLRRDARKSAWLSDDEVVGFKVRKTGKALSFCFVGRNPDGTVVNVRIGKVDAMSINAARQKAAEMRQQIEDGLCPRIEKDVSATKQKTKRVAQREARAWTLSKAIESKMEDQTLRSSSRKSYRSMLNVAMKPLADRRLDSITRSEWQRLVNKVRDEVSWVQATRVKILGAALYSHAMSSSEAMTIDNPLKAVTVKRTDTSDVSGQRRQHRLDENELHAWANRVDVLGNETASNLIKFILLTAMRHDEARLLTWSEIVGDVIVIPASRIKVHKELQLPITNAMWKILEKQKGKSKAWVFPRKHDKRQPIGPILQQCRTLGHSVHDLRRTALSIIDSMGVPSGVRLKIGNHSPASQADGYVVPTPEDVFATLTKYHQRLDTTIAFGQFRQTYPDQFQDQTRKSSTEADGGPVNSWI